jgi:hypothetical protein
VHGGFAGLALFSHIYFRCYAHSVNIYQIIINFNPYLQNLLAFRSFMKIIHETHEKHEEKTKKSV